MRKIINKYTISILGFYIFWLVLMPFVVSNMALTFCRNLSHNTQYEITISEPKTYFYFLPKAKFKIKDLSISCKDCKNKIVAEDLCLTLRLLPLLSGKVHINEIELGNINSTMYLEEQFVFDKDFFKRLETSNFVVDSLKIDKYNLCFYQKNVVKPIEYIGKDFLFQIKNKYVKFYSDNTIKVDDRVSHIHTNLYLPKDNDIKKTVFDINVDNFDISRLRIYFKNYLPKDLLGLRGNITVNANKDELVTNLKNFAILYEDSAKSIVFPELVEIKSKFTINRNFIQMDYVDIISKNIKFSFDGKVYNYFGKSMPSLDMRFRIDKSKVEDIVKILPALKFEEMDLYKLKKYKFYGDVIANFAIKGRMPEPDFSGDIYINNGVLVKPIPNTSRGATIKIKFNGRYADFDTYVPAGGLEYVKVVGTQELYNMRFANFVVQSSKNVDLKVTKQVLDPLHEILNFIIGPLPIMDVEGKGNIDITVKGNRKDPHIWGSLNLFNASANFIDLPKMQLRNSEATVKFNDQNVTFVNKSGVINGNEFKINGYSDLFGKFDFNINGKAQSTKALYESIKSSKMLESLSKMIPTLDLVNGNTDFNLNVYGAVKDIKDIKLNKNIFAKGDIVFDNNNLSIENIDIDKASGKVKFDVTTADANITASIGDLPLKVLAKIKDDYADVVLDIPKFNPNFLINDLALREKQYLPMISVNGKYKGNIENIDYKKLNLNTKIISSAPNSKITYNSGEVSIANDKIFVKNLKGHILNPQNIFQVDLRVDNSFSEKTNYNGNVKIKTPDLNLYNEIIASDIVPEEYRKYLKDFEFKKGILDLNFRVFNNIVTANSNLGGISLIYKPLEIPVNVVNGNLYVRNNVLNLNKINLLIDNMPVLLDGDVRDVFNKQNFNIYLNSKPQQDFIDKYINRNQIYPIKIKGDIVYWARFKGNKDNYEVKSKIDLSKDASIYHYGATVGDIENDIAVNLDSRIINNKIIKIKEFAYDKLINSQNGRQTKLNMLKANGNVELLKDDLAFEDFRIKTSNPTDARIFNIIFRKPNIKQGQFISDLKLNGKLSNPKVVGDFHIFETDIPFFDTTMKNIELVFKDKIIEIASKGEVMGNDVTFNGVMKNKLSTPYHLEQGLLATKNLDLNRIVEKLKLSEVDNVSTFESFADFELSSITFNKLKFKADNIQLRNIHATDYEALTSLNSKGLFRVEDFVFNIAQGNLRGKYSYNLKNNDMQLSLKADSINANDITWALCDLNNQIYGDLTGDINLACNGTNFESCMQTLNGETVFNVKDGNMPKLGSLEYLLKASNLLKGGLTGLSINSVIDIITPLKTGNFSDIYGVAKIKDGVADNIEISTRGKDLSLFMSGNYNFATSIANMEVVGMLSRKISTMFGPIGNMSINTLFNVIPGVDLSKDSPVLENINKIPGIELSSKAYRKFVADIKGNINGEDYVTSFKWIN